MNCEQNLYMKTIVFTLGPIVEVLINICQGNKIERTEKLNQTLKGVTVKLIKVNEAHNSHAKKKYRILGSLKCVKVPKNICKCSFKPLKLTEISNNKIFLTKFNVHPRY
jgi:hypothetical protein